MPRRSSSTSLLVAVLLGAGLPLAAQPVRNLNLIPDDLAGPGSPSMLQGAVPGPAGPLAAAFDFTASQRHGVAGFLTLTRDGVQPSLFDPTDLLLEGEDPALGASLRLRRDPALPGSVTTSVPAGSFPAGAVFTVQIPVLIEVQGAGLEATMPASGVLAGSGVFQPGFFHQAVLVQASIDTLPGVAVTFHLKEDLFVPGIRWRYVARESLSSLVPSPAQPLRTVRGRFVIQRHSWFETVFTIGPVELEAPGGPLVVIAAAAGSGPMEFFPATRSFAATLSGTVDGVPFVRVLDGVGESFTGPVSQPTGIRIEESGLPGIDHLVLDLRRAEIVPEGSAPVLGAVYAPVFRGEPGAFFVAGAALHPTPGISTEVGDIYVEVDDLLLLSTTPGNPFFIGFSGIMPATGQHLLTLAVPNEPLLAGFTFFLAGALLDPMSFVPIAVTNSHRVVL
jgi:hypothetical protein